MDEIDEETLRIMKSYCGGDPRIADEVGVQVFHEYADASWTISEFMAVIQNAVNTIPEQYRSDAMVYLEGGYDESSRLKITYTRLENHDEIDKRVNRALIYAKNKQAQELCTYQELKKKFEKDPT